jgi:hypothetical protein
MLSILLCRISKAQPATQPTADVLDPRFVPSASTPAADGLTIEKLASSYIGSLESLIAHCVSEEAGGYTPSDFALVHTSVVRRHVLFNPA